MADVELLPLPAINRYSVCGDIAYPVSEDADGGYVDYDDHVAAMQAYARANMEPLRAEVARKEALLETALGTVEAGNMFREAMCNEMHAAGCKVVATPDTIEVRNTRAERLAEALRHLRNHTSVNSHQIELIDAALHHAAAQEGGRD